MLAGAALIAIAGVAPSLYVLRTRRLAAVARLGMDRLVDAGLRFNDEYGYWPAPAPHGTADARFGGDRPNSDVVDILRGAPGPEGPGGAVNPGRTIFLEAGPFRPGTPGLDESGDYLDPWGTPYQVVVDTDLDGLCDVENSIYGTDIGEGMIVWSCGPDRQSDTKDDILSWRSR